MTLKKHYGLEDKALETVKFNLFGTVCHVWITCGNSGYSCEPQFPLKTDIQTCLAFSTKKTLLKDVDIMSIILETKTSEVTKLSSSLREALLFLLHEKIQFPTPDWAQPSDCYSWRHSGKAQSFHFSWASSSLLFSFSLYFLSHTLPRPPPFHFWGFKFKQKPKALLTQDVFVFLSFWLETRAGQIKWNDA